MLLRFASFRYFHYASTYTHLNIVPSADGAFEFSIKIASLPMIIEVELLYKWKLSDSYLNPIKMSIYWANKTPSGYHNKIYVLF
jgi:hypothetical protein